MDVWVVRYNAELPLHYWGFKQLGDAASRQALGFARSVLFVDGPRKRLLSSVQDLLYWFPDTPLGKVVQVWPCTPDAAKPVHLQVTLPVLGADDDGQALST